jgi:transposase
VAAASRSLPRYEKRASRAACSRAATPSEGTRSHKIENFFAKLKDWRRIATRYDRCAHAFFSAICIAAAVAFYLNQ